MLTVSIATKNPKTPVLDARSTNIKATKRPCVDFKALKRTHLQYSSPMVTCADHFTSTAASSMSHSTLSNVGFLAINSFQFSTYLLSPKTQWVITSSLHQLPDDLTFFTHQSISSPSKFTSIWGRRRISEDGPSTSALLQNLLRVQRGLYYTSRSRRHTGRHDEHKFLRTAQQELPESSKHSLTFWERWINGNH